MLTVEGEKPSPGIVGEVLIPIVRLPEGHPVEQWYQLTPRDGSKTCKGAIKLRILFQIRDDLYSTNRDLSPADDVPLSPSASGTSMLDESNSAPALQERQTSSSFSQSVRRGSLGETIMAAPTPGNLNELAQEELPTGLVSSP